MKVIIEFEYNPSEKSMYSILFSILKACRGLVDFKVRLNGIMHKNYKADLIKNEVCRFYNIDPDLLQSKRRKGPLVKTRQVIHYFLRAKTNKSHAIIAAEIGNLDHATCIHSIKTVNNLMETDKKVKKEIEELEGILMLKNI